MSQEEGAGEVFGDGDDAGEESLKEDGEVGALGDGDDAGEVLPKEDGEVGALGGIGDGKDGRSVLEREPSVPSRAQRRFGMVQEASMQRKLLLVESAVQMANLVIRFLVWQRNARCWREGLPKEDTEGRRRN